jgi:hypothetical protein
MNCEIGVAADDDRFDFAHEKALASHLSQWAILNPVTLCLDVHLVDVEVREVGAQLASDPPSLYEGEIAAPCCNA